MGTLTQYNGYNALKINNKSNELWRETLQAIADHGPIGARACVEHVTIAVDPEQVVSLIGKFVRRKRFLRVHDAMESPRRYVLTDAGREKLDELTNPMPPISEVEKKLVKRIAELEPVQPWEFEPETDAVVRDLATLRFSPDIPLYREGRERAGRLRYLAERLERLATTEGNNIAADLRETAGMLDKLTEVVK